VSMIKAWLVRSLPILSQAKAVAQAWWQRLAPRRASYSQGSEDAIVVQLCKGTLPAGPYVDIGANHPTRLSNTYLFYRFFGEFRGTVWRIPDRRWLRLGGWKH
jgi:hypothetical protein